MKFSRERFQNGSLRRVARKIGPDVWEFRYRDHSKPGLPMRQMTLSTVEYPSEPPPVALCRQRCLISMAVGPTLRSERQLSEL